MNFYNIEFEADPITERLPIITTSQSRHGELIKQHITNEQLWADPPVLLLYGDPDNIQLYQDSIRWSAGRPLAYHLVVSPKLKAVIEQFKLPPHRFYEAELVMNEPRGRLYYVLHIVYSPRKDLDFEQIQFTLCDIRRKPVAPPMERGAIKSFEAYERIKLKETQENELQPIPDKLHFKPGVYFDLWGYLPPFMMVSQPLKEAIQAAGITGISMNREYDEYKVIMNPVV